MCDTKLYSDPGPKPWIKIFAEQCTARQTLRYGGEVVTAGAGLTTLTADQFCNSVVIIGAAATGNVGIPLSAAIDAVLGVGDGYTFEFKVINRNPTNALVLASTEIVSQPIPRAGFAGHSATTTFYFKRIAGVWTPLNT